MRYLRSNPQLKAVLDAIAGGAFSPDEPGRYRGLVDALLWGGDHYLLLADYAAYVAAQAKVDALYRQPEAWAAQGHCQRRRHGAVLVGPHDPRVRAQIWHVTPAPERPLPRRTGADTIDTQSLSDTQRHRDRPGPRPPRRPVLRAGAARRRRRPACGARLPARARQLVVAVAGGRRRNAGTLLLVHVTHGRRRVRGPALPAAALPAACLLGRRHRRFDDPYRFLPVLGELDAWLLAEGTHLRPFEVLGATPRTHDGVAGTASPSGRRTPRVSAWSATSTTGTAAATRCACAASAACGRSSCPAWRRRHATSSSCSARDGRLLPLKADPYALQAELRPATASVVAPLPERVPPASPARQRPTRSTRRQHLRGAPRLLAAQARGRQPLADWDELADTLVPYAAEMGFTHLELLPISEHPFDGSWGYQPIGLYAPTARFGDPRRLPPLRRQRAHAAGLGVILDWVPAHFPTDAHGLAASTARTCTSTPTRARASTRTGTR
jgi:hypothetical protein